MRLNIKPARRLRVLVGVALVACWACISACSTDDAEAVSESNIERPVDMAISYQRLTADEYNRLSSAIQVCYRPETEDATHYIRPWGYSPSPATHVVSKLDLCNGVSVNQHWQSNPYIVSHIPVGLYPSAIESFGDGRYLLVLNSHENTFSVIDSTLDIVIGKPIEVSEQVGDMIITGENRNKLYVTFPNARMVASYEVSTSDPLVWEKGSQWVLPTAEDASCKGVYSVAPDVIADVQLDAHPIPGAPVVVDASGTVMALPNHSGRGFFMLNTDSGEFSCYDVAGPTTTGAVSLDGRWLYLAKRWQFGVAVFDLQAMVYTDTNEELPSHDGAVPGTSLISYDIAVSGTPKGITFAQTHKERGTKRRPDTEQGEDEDPDAVIYEETEEPGLRDYGYIVTHNGVLYTVDMTDDVHELFDAYDWQDETEDNAPHLFYQNDPVIEKIRLGPEDPIAELSEEGFDFSRFQTPNADWTAVFNGTIPGLTSSVSGRLDAENGRLYDPNVDFRALDILLPGDNNLGDRLVITTATVGRCPVSEIGRYAVSIEITAVGEDNSRPDDPDYIAFNVQGLPDLSRCFNTSVEYEIRANESYVVFASVQNEDDNVYQGRAIPKRIKENGVCQKDDLAEQWSFANDYLNFMICKVVDDPEEPMVRPLGLLPVPELFQYEFSTLSEIDIETISGVSFVGVTADPWEDGYVYAIDAGGDAIVRYSPQERIYSNIQ